MIFRIVLIITAIMMCIGVTYGQAPVLVPYGGSRPIDTSYSGRNTRIDSIVRLVKYGSTDTNMVLGVTVNGVLVLRHKGITSMPNLHQVTTAGNTTSNSITVGGIDDLGGLDLNGVFKYDGVSQQEGAIVTQDPVTNIIYKSVLTTDSVLVWSDTSMRIATKTDVANAGTVTSVGLTTGTTGTDVNVTNSPITTSGNIVLNIPSASATARGLVTIASQIFAGAKTFTDATTIQRAGIGITTVDGLVLENPTASTAGVTRQYSPLLRFRGTNWNTTVSRTHDIKFQLETGTTGSIYDASLRAQYSYDGAAYVDMYRVSRGLNDFTISTTQPEFRLSGGGMITIGATTAIRAATIDFVNGGGTTHSRIFNGTNNWSIGAITDDLSNRLQITGSTISDGYRSRVMTQGAATDSLVVWNTSDRLFKKYAPLPESQSNNTLQTTNATPSTVLPIPLTSSGDYLRVTVQMAGKTGNDMLSGVKYATVKNVAGTLSIVGGSVQDIVTTLTDGVMSGASWAITTSGTNVIIQVTGIAATTINWSAIIKYKVN